MLDQLVFKTRLGTGSRASTFISGFNKLSLAKISLTADEREPEDLPSPLRLGTSKKLQLNGINPATGFMSKLYGCVRSAYRAIKRSLRNQTSDLRCHNQCDATFLRAVELPDEARTSTCYLLG